MGKNRDEADKIFDTFEISIAQEISKHTDGKPCTFKFKASARSQIAKHAKEKGIPVKSLIERHRPEYIKYYLEKHEEIGVITFSKLFTHH